MIQMVKRTIPSNDSNSEAVKKQAIFSDNPTVKETILPNDPNGKTAILPDDLNGETDWRRFYRFFNCKFAKRIFLYSLASSQRRTGANKFYEKVHLRTASR